MSKVVDGIVKDLKNIPESLRKKMKGTDKNKLIRMSIPYVIVGYFCDKSAWMFRQVEGDIFPRLMDTASRLGEAFANPLPSFNPMDLLFGVACGVGFRLIVYFKAKNAKKFRHGVEYGSARWGNAKDIEPYMDPVFENNIILTASERLMMSGRPSSPKYARNKNILVIGGSGSGKTRFFVKPNLMQMHSSYVVTDPKGTVLVECGRMLKKGIPLLDDNGAVVKDDKGKTVYQPYKIKVLNTINFARSMHYNPFAYIRSEKDILKLVNTIIVNTKGEGQQSGEDFWVKAEKLLYTAYIGFIWYEAPEKEQNFSMLIDMIDASEAREDDESFKNPVDLLFDELEAEKPNHFAVRQYKKYKLAAGVISLKRLLNHHFLRNWSSKMIKKSLEAYFLPKTRNCTFLKTFSKDGNILPRQSGYSVRNFSNRHKIQRNLKKLRYYLVKQRPKDGLSERNFFEDPYTNLDNGAACHSDTRFEYAFSVSFLANTSRKHRNPVQERIWNENRR